MVVVVGKKGTYVVRHVIGDGAQSVVYRGFDEKTGDVVVVKKYDRTQTINAYRNEKRALAIVKHENVPRLIDRVYLEGERALVLEYVDGQDLCEYLNQFRGNVDYDLMWVFFRQIAEAVRACHDLDVAHRDVKLENVLVDDRSRKAHLIDFGFSSVVRPDTLIDDYCGSIMYASPELINNTLYEGKPADVWSLGVVLYAMLVGEMPFNTDSRKKLVRLVNTADPDLPNRLPSKAKELIKWMLQKWPSDRPTIEQVCEHPWVKSK